MAKYKDVDRLMAILEYQCNEADNVEAWLAFEMACEDVRDLPDADVVEVCRCEYCSKSSEHLNGRWCIIHQTVVQDSDYCSYGVRKR